MAEYWKWGAEGKPWTIAKMKEAAKRLAKGATVYVDSLECDDLFLQMDDIIFKPRPDLILQLSSSGANPNKLYEPFSDKYIEALSNAKYIRNVIIRLRYKGDYSALGKLKGLRYLEIYAAKPIDLAFLSAFEDLDFLRLGGAFCDLSPISYLRSLKTLILDTAIAAFDFLKPLEKLDYLLLGCCRLEDADFSSLLETKIKTLHLSQNRGLTNIDFIGDMRSPTTISINQPKVEKLFDCSKLQSLKELHLDTMRSLNDISALKSAANLETLYIMDINPKLKGEALNFLADLPNLENLYVDFIYGSKKRLEALREAVKSRGKERILKEGICVLIIKNLPRTL
jgi:hypothetical protein